MCTLALAFRTDRRFPLVVAANRDERISRPSEGWRLRGGGAIPYAAPGDLERGGTWMGLSARGLFAGVTNVFTGDPPAPERRSRGELVGLALAHPGASAARAALERLDAAEFNPFQLAVADLEDAFLWRWDGRRAGLEALAPGLHVVTERGADGQEPRAARVRDGWPLDLSPPHLFELLSGHAPEEPVCVHLGAAYGTRSSAVLRLTAALAASELWAADGPPCTTPFEDRAELLAALARSA